jgi:hypothetical protein
MYASRVELVEEYMEGQTRSNTPLGVVPAAPIEYSESIKTVDSRAFVGRIPVMAQEWERNRWKYADLHCVMFLCMTLLD